MHGLGQAANQVMQTIVLLCRTIVRSRKEMDLEMQKYFIAINRCFAGMKIFIEIKYELYVHTDREFVKQKLN